MQHFTIYSKPNCSYCEKAKSLIKAKGFTYEELVIDVGQPKASDTVYVTTAMLLEKVPAARSVPQIFSGETLIGGFEALRQSLI